MTKQFAGPAALLAAVLALAPGCGRQHDVPVTDTIEEAPRLASVVRTNDPATASQLVAGFWDVEAKAWRWTMKSFAVKLHPPAHAAQNGAVLELRFSIPKSSIDKLGSITVTASVAGTALAPETYGKAGENTYRREVPALALATDPAKVDFSLDKAVPPGDVDKRELGVVASSIGLVAK